MSLFRLQNSWAFAVSAMLFAVAMVRAGSTGPSPWWSLDSALREKLSPALNNSRHYAWLLPQFREWRQRHSDDVGSTGWQQFYFDEVLDRESRNQLLAVQAKLESEGLWSYVGRVTWAAGAGGAILFVPTIETREFQKVLVERGYGDYWLASRGSPWGFRSNRRGAQLHFRGGDPINVHIDLNNPGDDFAIVRGTGFAIDALQHLASDLYYREETHQSPAVQGALADEGIAVTKSR